MQEGRQDAHGGELGLFICIQYFNPHQVAIFNVLHLKSSVTSEKCTFICTKEKYKLCDCCSIMQEPCRASRHPSCDQYAPIILQYQQHLKGHSAKLSIPILHSIGERGSNCDLSSVLGKWSVLTPHFNGHVSYNNNFCVQLNTCSY